ncbi:unnamed protein product [Blepharisma stoltei]|uniref:Ubiquitin-like protease family profile domain-containing protein n=1 Tax=Blepharisma stoltei TaxID=1481888 RepID=A0AAU9J6U5_9CILI|nr:unnamed protein product [Blepharisma stoltei]
MTLLILALNKISTDEAKNQDPDPVLVIYPPDSKSSITIRESDFSRLNPIEFLNDNLVDFFIKYFITESNKDNFFAFSSFFYVSIVESGYDKVLKWNKGCDIFEKDFWIIPIADNNHWLLLIVAYPQYVFIENSEIQPAILLFDSLSFGMEDLAHMVRIYIGLEWAQKQGLEYDSVQEDDIPLVIPSVPQQNNWWDCGIYVINYAKKFIESPEPFLLDLNCEEIFDMDEFNKGRWIYKNILNQLGTGNIVKEGVNIYLKKSKRRHRRKPQRPLDEEFYYENN